MRQPLTREEILSVLQEQKEYLQQQFYVKKIGLFGSFARDEANEDSDIDF